MVKSIRIKICKNKLKYYKGQLYNILMARTNRITDQLYGILNDKLDNYRETMEENILLYNSLLETIKNKTDTNTITITSELISRIDDVLEDIVTTNVNCKIIIQTLNNNVQLTSSNREVDRLERYRQLQQFIPFLFLLSQLNHSS
jgi:hypothetical protein